MSINGVITPKNWLHFWLHNGYTMRKVCNLFLRQKKPFLYHVSILLGLRGTGEGRAFQQCRRRVVVDFSENFWVYSPSFKVWVLIL